MKTGAMTLEEAHRVGPELVRTHVQRFTEYMTALDDAAVFAPVPGSCWTVGETVTHIQSVVLRYTVDDRRVDKPSELVARNADDVAALGVDVPAALASINEQIEHVAAVASKVELSHTCPFHAGQAVTLAGGWGNLLGELLAHGDDIAQATGAPFVIASADLEIMWRYTAPLLDSWLTLEARTHRDSWWLELPFGAIAVEFDGALRWGVQQQQQTTPDHIIEVADAAEFALAFPYGRRPISDATTALLAARFHEL